MDVPGPHHSHGGLIWIHHFPAGLNLSFIVSRWRIEMLNNDEKLQVFMKLRSENYRASLRLEGLVQSTASVSSTDVEFTEPVPGHPNRDINSAALRA